jgi:hypothetical protein
MNQIDFTYDGYRELLGEFDAAGYTWSNYEQAIGPKTAILRHDVDYSPRKALTLATIEANRGVTGAYLFLVRSPFYNVFDPEISDIIREIHHLGHDIGLHFDSHAYWESEPSHGVLLEEIKTERQLLETVVDSTIPVVSFHNPPSWALERSFDAFVSTYEQRFFDVIEYVADSNQRWRDSNPFVPELPDRLQLLLHPVLWDDRPGDVQDRLRDEWTYIIDRIETSMVAQNDVLGRIGGFEESD